MRVGILNIVPGGPDCVFSGINYGYNMASDIQYSATAGAAFEAAFQKVHAIAFSEDAGKIHEVTDRYLKDVMEELMEKPLEKDQIWNVNFPGCSLEECRGILRDRKVSTDNFYHDVYHETILDSGRISYLLDAKRGTESSEGTDLHEVLNHYVSIGKVNNIS